MADDDEVTTWVEGVRAEQRRHTPPPTRNELTEALGYANISAQRLRGTVYYASAHARINELLDELVGL